MLICPHDVKFKISGEKTFPNGNLRNGDLRFTPKLAALSIPLLLELTGLIASVMLALQALVKLDPHLTSPHWSKWLEQRTLTVDCRTDSEAGFELPP